MAFASQTVGEAMQSALSKCAARNARKEAPRGHDRSRFYFKSIVSFASRNQSA